MSSIKVKKPSNKACHCKDDYILTAPCMFLSVAVVQVGSDVAEQTRERSGTHAAKFLITHILVKDI